MRPTATLYDPVVREVNAALPTAVFPVEFDVSKANAPTAVFYPPVVFVNNASRPTAVLLSAVVFAFNAL